MMISGTMTIGELGRIPSLSKVKDFIFTNLDDEKYESQLQQYGIEQSRLIEALEYTAKRCEAEDFVLSIYSGEKPFSDAGKAGKYKMIYDKADVCLLNYAVHPGKSYILVCPGGGYNREWVLVEGYPLAMRINELGYNAFILIYRTGKTGLFPEPLEDYAAAVNYIEKHKDELKVETEGYAVTGASAGGHLCSMWGTKQKGYEAYGAAKPKALLLSYPAPALSMFYEIYEKCVENKDTAGAEGQAALLRRVGGADFDRDKIGVYSLENLIDKDYPPTYFVHAEDDPVVPIVTGRRFEALLEQYGIRKEVHIVGHAGHSFGLGIRTDAEGWLEEAVRFWQSL